MVNGVVARGRCDEVVVVAPNLNCRQAMTKMIIDKMSSVN